VRRALAIARRDFAGLFLTPTGPVVSALFVFMAGWAFQRVTFQPGEAANLRAVFEFAGWELLVIAPALTMRAFSEEIRAGTLELLFTSALRDRHIVLGKFFAATAFLLVMLAPTLVLAIALEIHGRPDYGELLCGLLGLLLVGMAYIASGLFASTITSSQVISYLLSLFFWLSVSVAVMFLPTVLPPEWADVVFALNHSRRLRDFTIGLVDTANVAYFLAITSVFLIMASASLAIRRAR
jgi:ABC-2 type transport system permease protein